MTALEPGLDLTAEAAAGLGAGSLASLFELFWHPVCTVEELRAVEPRPLAVQLLGRRLAVADLGEAGLAAVADRCLHRSARLSVGWVEEGSFRCGYHGWRWSAGGRCVDIPSLPEGPIPPRACIDAYEAQLAYGLVWVRLDPSADTTIPACPAWDDASMKVLAGAPYTWPVAAPRRVENFVDLAHFAWVHDGTLGKRDEPVPPLPTIGRTGGELRFVYDPPEMEPEAEALFGRSTYRMPIPLTVSIDFELATGAHRNLWMTASPLDDRSCRTFWFVSRDDALDEDDAAHLAFQDVILQEDEPLVTNQDPPELLLEPGFELSVRTDRVSIEYRRWLRELAAAQVASGSAGVIASLAAERSAAAPASEEPS